VHPKVVQERLGHANVSITLNIYSHVAPTLHDDAADTVSKIMRGKRETDGRWRRPLNLFMQVRGRCLVSEGGLEPPRPLKGTSTSS
jgi:hypothetical protein